MDQLDNGGKDWQHHTAGFPAVQVADLKIHPREHDLIIGTFGRAAWILDDIRPLRALAKSGPEMLRDSFAVFPAPDAYQWSRRSYQGTRFYAQGQFQGDDRPSGAMLTYWVLPPSPPKGGMPADQQNEMEGENPPPSGGLGGEQQRPDALYEADEEARKLTRYTARPQGIIEDIPARENERFGMLENPDASSDDPDPVDGPKDKVKVQVVDVQSGDTIRTYQVTPKWGMNRTSWNMRRDGIRYPSRREVKDDADLPSGPSVAPGVYEVIMTYGNHTGKTKVTVAADPREEAPNRADRRGADLQADLDSIVVNVDRSWTKLQDAGTSIKLVEQLLEDAPKATKDSLTADIKELRKRIAELEELFTEPEDLKGIQRNPTNLQAQLYRASGYVSDVEGAPSQMATVSVRLAREAAKEFRTEVATFMQDEFSGFRREVETASLGLFRME